MYYRVEVRLPVGRASGKISNSHFASTGSGFPNASLAPYAQEPLHPGPGFKGHQHGDHRCEGHVPGVFRSL